MASATTRVGVAEVGDDDARREVDVGVAVDVGERDAVAPLVGDGEQRHHPRQRAARCAATMRSCHATEAGPGGRHDDPGSSPTGGFAHATVSIARER